MYDWNRNGKVNGHDYATYRFISDSSSKYNYSSKTKTPQLNTTSEDDSFNVWLFVILIFLGISLFIYVISGGFEAVLGFYVLFIVSATLGWLFS